MQYDKADQQNCPRRVVFYGRVSTELEAQISALKNQMNWYLELAEHHPNWTVVGQYADEGISGTGMKTRPSFMKMLLDQLAEVHAVVGRKVEHQLAAVQRVFGIDQLHFQVMGGNALLTDVVRLLHIGAVLAHTAHVHGVRHADDRLDLAGEARHLMRGSTTSRGRTNVFAG